VRRVRIAAGAKAPFLSFRSVSGTTEVVPLRTFTKLDIMAGLRGGYGQVCGEGLAGGPDGAVDEGLLFPDGDGLLEGVNEPAGGFVGLGAVGGGDDDEHAGFADLEASEAVDDGDMADIEAGVGFGCQLPHLFLGHLAVGFVVEMEGLAATGLVAHDAVKNHDCAVFATLDCVDHRVRINALMGESSKCRQPRVAEDREIQIVFSSAGDGWEQADLVAGVEDLGGRGVFGIDTDGDGLQGPRTRSGVEMVKEFRNGCAVGQLDR